MGHFDKFLSDARKAAFSLAEVFATSNKCCNSNMRNSLNNSCVLLQMLLFHINL